MLKPEPRKYPSMSEDQLARFQVAIAEERAAKADNIAAAKKLLPSVLAQCDQAVDLIRRLKDAREKAGISLSEMEARTGILESALSQLENSHAPNPSLSYLQRYAQAIGCRLVLSLHSDDENHET